MHGSGVALSRPALRPATSLLLDVVECVSNAITADSDTAPLKRVCCEQADDKKAEHWEAHGVKAAAQTSRGCHLLFLSALLKKNAPEGKGFVVGSKLSIADCILMDLLELYMRAFPSEMADLVRPLLIAEEVS